MPKSNCSRRRQTRMSDVTGVIMITCLDGLILRALMVSKLGGGALGLTPKSRLIAYHPD